MSALMSDIVSIAGRALESEDQELKKIFEGRRHAGGVLRIELERYYQYIFWRAILPKYDAHLQFTHDEGYVPDLRLYYEETHYFFEMKYWREEHWGRLIADIKKLGGYITGGYLVVFSANPAKVTEENLRSIDQLPGVKGREGVYSFDTTNRDGKAVQFWVGIWHVPSQRQTLA